MPDDAYQVGIGQTRVLLCCPTHGWQWVSLEDTMMFGAFRSPFGVCACGQVCGLIARYGVNGVSKDRLS